MISAPAVAPKIAALESVRGVAAVLVVFYHMPKWHPALDNALFNNAYLMVELFFVLSGFVIQTAYGRRITTGADLARFQFLRFARLYPVHLLFLFGFLGIEVLKYLIVTKTGVDTPNTAPFAVNNARAFVENLLLLNGVLPGRPFTFNYPAWSISVEFYTYLLFGLIVLIAGRFAYGVFLGLAGIALGLLAAGVTAGFDPMLKCCAGFFLGCLLAAAVRGRRGTVPDWAAGAALAAMVIYLLVKPTGGFDLLIYPLSAGVVLCLALARAGGVIRVLCHPVLVGLGAVSYSLYMAHASVLWVANQIARRLSSLPQAADATGRLIPQLPGGLTLVLAALSVLAVLVLAALVHRWVERPLRDRSRRVDIARLLPAGPAGWRVRR